MDKRTDFEWLVLDHAGAIQDLGVAYGLAKTTFRDRHLSEIDELVRTALLQLLDDECILFFRSSWDDGFNEDPASVTPLSREEVATALEPGHRPDDSRGEVIFFVETQKGADAFAALPAHLVERIRRQERAAEN